MGKREGGGSRRRANERTKLRLSAAAAALLSLPPTPFTCIEQDEESCHEACALWREFKSRTTTLEAHLHQRLQKYVRNAILMPVEIYTAQKQARCFQKATRLVKK